MNVCRLCPQPIPERLCFCDACTKTKLDYEERNAMLVPRSAAARKELADRIVARIRGPSRPTKPPRFDSATAAFRNARRLMKPIIEGKRR